MNESLLARRYAKALLSYATEVGEAGELYPIMDRLWRELRPEPSVREVVSNPTLSCEQRAACVVALAGGGAESVPDSLRRFVDLVFAHRRQSLLGAMGRAYVELYRKACNITHAQLITATEIDSSTRSQIERLVAEEFGGTVELVVEIDREIIGGFLLRVGGRLMDGSVKGQLERIRQQFITKNRSIV